EVAEHHRGRAEEHLAERGGGELDRQPARGEHATLDRVDQLREVAVAVIEAAPRIGDTDHGLREQRARIPHVLGERAPQVERKPGVAVVGEPARETVLRPLRHLIDLLVTPTVALLALALALARPLGMGLMLLVRIGEHAAQRLFRAAVELLVAQVWVLFSLVHAGSLYEPNSGSIRV